MRSALPETKRTGPEAAASALFRPISDSIHGRATVAGSAGQDGAARQRPQRSPVFCCDASAFSSYFRFESTTRLPHGHLSQRGTRRWPRRHQQSRMPTVRASSCRHCVDYRLIHIVPHRRPKL